MAWLGYLFGCLFLSLFILLMTFTIILEQLSQSNQSIYIGERVDRLAEGCFFPFKINLITSSSSMPGFHSQVSTPTRSSNCMQSHGYSHSLLELDS